MNHYFGAAWSQLRALHFGPDHALDVVSLADFLARIDLAQKDVDRLHPTAVEAYETITQADEQILKARKAVALLEIGFVINASEFGLDEPNLACARPAVEQARANRAAAISRLSGWEEACCLRINLALLIPERPDVCGQIPEGALQRRGELSGFSSMLSGLYPALLELREETEVQATLQYNRQSNMPRLPTALESTSQKIERLLAQIEQAVAHLPDPFSPESERRTLLDSIRYCPFPTDSDDRHALLVDRGQTAWWSLFDVQFRINGELLSIAREAERIARGGA